MSYERTVGCSQVTVHCSRCSRLSPTGTFLENHGPRRLNFKRSLADTTAESYASVKHTDHIDQLRFAFCVGRYRRGWCGADPIRRRAEQAICRLKSGGSSSTFSAWGGGP